MLSRLVIESSYPISFRKDEAGVLGKHLRNRHSVVMVGMKRVGISNFLRFFLYHKDIAKTHIQDNKTHLFIPVDLHDLVERELFPFWILTFKRLVDSIEDLKNPSLKKLAESLFLDSIQSNNLFLTIEHLKKCLVALVDLGIMPTIFFIRFDRIIEAANHEFFENLIGIQDATREKLSYVFTSFRNLHTLSPDVFPKTSVSTFAHEMFLKPAVRNDIEIIYSTYKSRYKLPLSPNLEKQLFNLVDGNIQYLQLSLIILHEQKKLVSSEEALKELLLLDERIILQSEELWESLTVLEKEVLLAILKKQQVTDKQKKEARYLWDTGMLSGKNELFSLLFFDFVREKEKEENAGELSKKEHTLFELLQKNLNEICEREQIVEIVWPEVEELGVSDWAIDRLVARLRSKLLSKNEYEIQTIKTRGFKLIKV